MDRRARRPRGGLRGRRGRGRAARAVGGAHRRHRALPPRPRTRPPSPRAARSPFALRPAADPPPVQVEFNRAPRAGILFDVDTGEVLWERHPRRELPIASLTKMMTALSDRGAPPTLRTRPDHPGGARLRGVGRRRAAEGKEGEAGDDAQRAAAGVGQRRRDRARATRRRQRAAFRATDEQAGPRGSACGARASPARTGSRTAATTRAREDLAALARADLANRRISAIARTDHARFPFPIRGGFLDLYNNNPFIRAGVRAHHGAEDRLYRRGGTLLRDHREARWPAPRRRAAPLPQAARPGAGAAARGRAPRLDGHRSRPPPTPRRACSSP